MLDNREKPVKTEASRYKYPGGQLHRETEVTMEQVDVISRDEGEEAIGKALWPQQVRTKA